MAWTARQEELLGLARQLFSVRGYAATSMRDLADAAGVLPGSLYAHFRSKAEILGALVEGFYDELLPVQEAAVASDAPGIDRLVSMLEAILPVVARRRQDFLVVSSEWLSMMNEPTIAACAAKAQRSFDLWSEVVEAGQSDGSLRADVTPDFLVSMTTFALIGVVQCSVASPSPMPVEAVTLILRSMVAAVPDRSFVP